MFSVLISVYHKEKSEYFERSLKSIYVEQILKPSEIILIKDGPLNQELDDVIDVFCKEYPGIIKIYSFKKNKGLGFALKYGVEKASNELIARMDTDDVAYPDRFEKQIKFMLKHPDIDVLGASIEEFNNEVGDTKRIRKVPENHKDIIKFSKYRNPINHPTVVYKKSSVLSVGNYKTDLLLWEDYNLWIDMLAAGKKFNNLPDVVLFFRVDNKQMIERRRGKKYAINEVRFANRAYKLNFFSLFEYFRYIVTKPIMRLLPVSVLSYLYSFFRSEK